MSPSEYSKGERLALNITAIVACLLLTGLSLRLLWVTAHADFSQKAEVSTEK